MCVITSLPQVVSPFRRDVNQSFETNKCIEVLPSHSFSRRPAGEFSAAIMDSTGRFEALKDLDEESEESLLNGSTSNSRKRKHPSCQEASNPAKHGAKSSENSLQENERAIQKPSENFHYLSSDKGPFQILLTTHKEQAESVSKVLLDIQVARILTQKYNVSFDNMEKKGKNKWILSFKSKEQANNALSNSLIAESMFQVKVPWYAFVPQIHCRWYSD